MKKFWERFKDWFKTIVNGAATPPTPKPVETPVTPPTPVFGPIPVVPVTNPFEKYRGLRLAEVYMDRSRYGIYGLLTSAEEAQAKEAGVIFPVVVDIGPAVDRTGFVISDGQVKVNPNTADNYQHYQFTVTKTKQKFSVFGSPGAYFSSATAYIVNVGHTKEQPAFGVGTEFDFELTAGDYEFAVKVNGSGNLGVQYTQW